MDAVCDLKYNISDYLDTGIKDDQSRFRSQPESDRCQAPSRHRAELGGRTRNDWERETRRLLEKVSRSPNLDWYVLYNAMQGALPGFVAVKETSELERDFAELAEQWRSDTAAMSAMESMAMHPAYQRIIGMGPAVLHLILSELAREPDHWFWALSAITGENPVSPEVAGNLTRMTEAWLQLGRKRGWI